MTLYEAQNKIWTTFFEGVHAAYKMTGSINPFGMALSSLRTRDTKHKSEPMDMTNALNAVSGESDWHNEEARASSPPLKDKPSWEDQHGWDEHG